MKNKIFTFSLLLIFSCYLFPMEKSTGENPKSPNPESAYARLLTLYQSGNLENTKNFLTKMSRTERTQLHREVMDIVLAHQLAIIDLQEKDSTSCQYVTEKTALEQLCSIHDLICEVNKTRK